MPAHRPESRHVREWETKPIGKDQAVTITWNTNSIAIWRTSPWQRDMRAWNTNGTYRKPPIPTAFEAEDARSAAATHAW